MIPPKTDERWQKIIENVESYTFAALPTKMLMMRVKLLAKDNTPQKIEEAISVAHDFFIENYNYVKSDIELLFGHHDELDS